MSTWKLKPGEFLPDSDDVIDAQVLGWNDITPDEIIEAIPTQSQEESIVRAYATIEVDHPRT
jgi:hypothetical protein